jgi:hypothetical protein
MIQETIAQIETRLREAGSPDDPKQQELLGLLGTLKAEVVKLSQDDAEQAQSITRFALASAHEATRQQKKPVLLEHSLRGLTASVEGFEETHPALVQIVSRISTTLSNLGI